MAAGFPTTVAPIVQYGFSPKTKAHSLGNPFNLRAVKEFCDKHNLWLIEDNCDALGSTYEGTWGDIVVFIHMTMGEGGATP